MIRQSSHCGLTSLLDLGAESSHYDSNVGGTAIDTMSDEPSPRSPIGCPDTG